MIHPIDGSGDVEGRAEEDAIGARAEGEGAHSDHASEGPEGTNEVEAHDEDADDENQGPRELEEGEEYCPICQRLNCPGACDVCEHYVGNYWDGLIMWEIDLLQSFARAWSDLVDLVEGEVAAAHEDPIAFCGAVALHNQMPAKFLDPDLLSEESSRAIQELVDFSSGASTETDGMLSGSGYTLYLASTKPVEDLVASIQALIAAVRKALQ